MPDSSSTVRFWLLNALVWVLYGVAGIGLRQAYSAMPEAQAC